MLTFRNKFRQWPLFVFAALLTVIVVQAFTEKPSPLEQTRALCLQQVQTLQDELDRFQRMAEQDSSAESLKIQLKQSRIAFKRIEYLVEYIDNRQYPFINGANAIEMDDGYNPNAKPEGLQVIESELFEDTLNYDRIIFLTKQLKFRVLSFYLIFKEAQLSDTYIFEAIRYHLIRIETLSLVAFDSPDLRNSIQEILAALGTFRQVLGYFQTEVPAKEGQVLLQQLEQTVQYLQQKEFTTLDRLYFIKNYLHPLTKSLIALQQKLNIRYLDEQGKLFRVTNIRLSNIYDRDFLNPRFFAQDKYYPESPLYAQLGKKLFYDKRLSSDGSMSCGTCHQPEQAFSDKLPTAITNQVGQFQLRNTPSLLNVAFQAGYFHDFAAATLENQVDHVIANPQEFNHSYDRILPLVQADTGYVRLFSQAFPDYKENAVSIYGIQLCLAEFQRQMVFLNAPFDKYMRGESAVLDPAVKRGFNLFMGKALCGSCHFAPTFFGLVPPFYGTSESEVLGLTKTFDTLQPVLDNDIGRFKHFPMDPMKASFKTPTVRNAELTAPYMHHGGFRTLEEVVEFYNVGGGAGLGLPVDNQTLSEDRLHLTVQEKKDIVAFMKALTDTSGIRRFWP